MRTTEVLERLDSIEARLTTPPREYLSVAETANFLGLSKQSLDLWRINGGGPPWHRVGRRGLYSVRDLRDFMAQHRREPLS